METKKFIELNIEVDAETRHNSIEMRLRNIYFYDYVYTEQQIEPIKDLIKEVRRMYRVRIITITILEGSTNYGERGEMLESIRFADRGAGEAQIAKYENGRYDFDSANIIEMTAAKFLERYAKNYDATAHYNYIERK
jgi:hypothetical protein